MQHLNLKSSQLKRKSSTLSVPSGWTDTASDFWSSTALGLHDTPLVKVSRLHGRSNLLPAVASAASNVHPKPSKPSKPPKPSKPSKPPKPPSLLQPQPQKRTFPADGQDGPSFADTKWSKHHFFACKITPSSFLNLASGLTDDYRQRYDFELLPQEDQDTINLMVESLKQTDSHYVGTCFLQLSWLTYETEYLKVINHDGRHRMMALHKLYGDLPCKIVVQAPRDFVRMVLRKQATFKVVCQDHYASFGRLDVHADEHGIFDASLVCNIPASAPAFKKQHAQNAKLIEAVEAQSQRQAEEAQREAEEAERQHEKTTLSLKGGLCILHKLRKRYKRRTNTPKMLRKRMSTLSKNKPTPIRRVRRRVSQRKPEQVSKRGQRRVSQRKSKQVPKQVPRRTGRSA